jgi:hypothetical protein
MGQKEIGIFSLAEEMRTFQTFFLICMTDGKDRILTKIPG